MSTRVKFRCATALIGLFMGGVAPAACQDNKDEIIQKLIERVDVLERQVAALQQAGQPAQPAPVTPTPSTPSEVAAPEPADVSGSTGSRFTFHGYADVGFLRNEDGASDKRFALGEMDLFATFRMSPTVTVLVETVLETDNQVLTSSVPVNVERLLLQYRYNDYFNLDAGSYRTAIGYYSTAYLRGSWFQTALTRPKLFTFEDDGGFLPLHNVGLSANGSLPSGGLGLHYVVEVGSARNYAQPGSEGLDFSQNGAINAALSARPPAVSGLDVGFSSYHDRFVPEPGYFMARSVWTGHVVYQGHRFELLNEGVLARFSHPDQGYASVAGFYSQLAYHAGGSWTPYARLDYANVYGRGEVASYAPQYVQWRRVETAGIRYDLTDTIALKFEIGREYDRSTASWIQAGAQLAFTF